MKTRLLTLLLVIGFIAFTGCNSDDDNSTQKETMSGVWNLKNVRGGLLGIDIDYSQGEVNWNFNLESGTLIVQNNITSTGPEAIYSGPASGTYSFEITQIDGIQTLLINNIDNGTIILLNDNLKLDDNIAADGFIREFER
jgi:hypothetical protein